MTALLEVTVHHARDVPGAQEGGADRLFLEAPGRADAVAGCSPDLAEASAVLRGTDLPVRVILRLRDDWTTTGGEFHRLVGLAEEYLAVGAAGVGFGFLDADLEVDLETCAALAGSLPGTPWTFHRAVDSCLDSRRAWRHLPHLPGLDAVHSSGSLQGMSVGYDDLLALAADERVARLVQPGDGMLAEHVPWLVRAGVRQFRLGAQARPGGSAKAFVDAGHVRSWRLLLDDATARAG
jgi:copper homeostasis protein